MAFSKILLALGSGYAQRQPVKIYMHNFDAVIFDLDGLLLDTERLAFKAFHSACSTLNLGDLSNLYMKCIGTNSEMGKSILRDVLKGISDFEDFSLMWRSEYIKLTDGCPIPFKKGVEELLNHMWAPYL